MSGFNLDDYVDVAARIGAFYAKHPEGSLQAELVELTESRVVMRGVAYRTPEDPRPAVAHSMLGIPGTTPYTRGSEIENAETSAIGRAIAMLGFEVKKGIASREEVRNKQTDARTPAAVPPGGGGSEPTLVELGRETHTGKVTKGDGANNDVQYHQSPMGHRIGFKLALGDGKALPQVIADGAVGEAMFLTVPLEELLGAEVTVEGVAYRVETPGRRAYRRLMVDRISGRDFAIPATEAPSVPMFEDGKVADLDDLPF